MENLYVKTSYYFTTLEQWHSSRDPPKDIRDQPLIVPAQQEVRRL